MRKHHLTLTAEGREQLKALVSKGQQSVHVVKRASGLLALDRGATLEEVAVQQGVTNDTVRAWRKRYEQKGLAGLVDAPRSGRPIEIDGEQRAQITALACSEPPAGHGRWTLRLLADKVVELGYCEGISHTQVRKILKKTR